MSDAVSTALDSAQSGYDQAVNAAIEGGDTMIPENGLIALIVTTALVAIAAGLAIWQWTKRRNDINASINKVGDGKG